MPESTNYYQLLGIPFDSTDDEIRNAYREIARRVHPDVSRNPETTEHFILVQKAYETLSDPEQRSLYDQALPASYTRPPVLLSTIFSRSTLQRTTEPQLLYVLLSLAANPEKTTYTSPPLNVCLVIDRSTSMQGIVMDTVKNTAIEVIRQLRPEDVISIVSFSDRAEVVVPAGYNLDRTRVEHSIHMLNPGGGTEIFKGLEKGFAEVRRYRAQKMINHIILITDGRTYGDEQACEELAEQAARLQIGISSLGIGGKWNDHFLDRLATKTGGSTMYISKPKDVELLLKEKFRSLGDCYTNQAFLKFTLVPGVELRSAFRLQPETNWLECSSPISLGTIHQGTSLDVMLEFFIPSRPYETGLFGLLKGRLFFEIPSREDHHYSMRLNLTCPTSHDPDQTPPPQSIVQALSQLTLYRMQERARQEVSKGKYQEATRRLQNLASNLLAQGQKELASTVLREAANIQQNSSFSEEGEKRIKYGTRALLLPESKEEKGS